ncbi:hypothetical protein [Hymenobacter terrenus]|uniref:hypothetical protein n=1 Tax=Hymenobacter terrenus TaxID=1629124 RepID=UPI0006198923|nr:hypothetical protein [Hymenobacter terrenus]
MLRPGHPGYSRPTGHPRHAAPGRCPTGRPAGSPAPAHYDGFLAAPAPAAADDPARPAKPGIPPRYAPVTGLYKQYYHQELHKGYYKRQVQSNDYYVPWCSLRPHQTIHLKLEVTFLNSNAVQPTNWFTVLPDANYLVTINGQPNTGPMHLVPVDKQVLDVTIECLHPAPETSLKIVDELGAAVGELTLAENQFAYELPVRVVYLLLGRPMNPKDPLGATPPRPLYAASPHAQATLQKGFEALDFLNYVNTHTLNQALITCVVTAPKPPLTPPTTKLAPAYQVLLDEDQLKKDGIVLGGLLQGGANATTYCEKVANATPGVGPFAGLTIFVHELDVPPPAPGAVTNAAGTIFPVEAKTLIIYRTGLSTGSQRTIAHELGHVLGLTHSFLDTNDADATAYGKTIDNLQGQLIDARKSLATATQASAIQQFQQEVKALTNAIARLNTSLDVYRQNAFKFRKSSTENMMDYEPGTIRLSYWQWQWRLMQADVANYYGTKNAAK